MRGLAVGITLTLVAVACGAESEAEFDDDASTPPAVSRPQAPVGPGTTTTLPTTTTQPPPPPPAPLEALAVDVISRDFVKPVFADAPPGDDRLFVVEQDGRIHIVADGEVEAVPFLDIDPLVGSSGLEQGLLGLAFHPSYAANGRFFVYYTDNAGTSHLVGYQVSEDPDVADPDSARTILSENQPAGNHNGGMLEFGPDGYLYVALGDGGGANDQFGNGQRSETLLGTILRLDIDAADPYAVPPDNPFVDGGGAAEVFYYGLRNPWRFSIDDGHLYVGDVGQDELEEVDAIPLASGGANLGWPIWEGTLCLDDDNCSDGSFVAPVVEFDHAEGCSVIGGYVYRGDAIPELDGHYFYSDWCGGFLRSFRLDGESAQDPQDWTVDIGGSLGNVLSFGTDGAGELYLMNGEGALYKVVPVR